jgi:hypothetical protein
MQTKLMEMSQRLDSALNEFYYPNMPALAAAVKMKGSGIGRRKWQKVFRDARKEHPKPAEWLTDPSVKSFRGKVFKAPVATPHDTFKEQYRTHAYPLLEIQKRYGTGEGHAKVARTMGFTTNRQGFVSRGEAQQRAWKKGIRIDDPEAPWRKKSWKGLHSSDMRGHYGPP